jgi:hypothetical protein
MTDYTKVSKNEWLDLAEVYYDHLIKILEGFSKKEWNKTTSYLGWNCRRVLAHMTSAITINFNLLLEKALTGNPVPEPDFNFFLRNANDVKKRSKLSTSELRAEFQTEISKILSKFRSLTEEEWLKPAWFYVGMVNIRTLFLVQFSDNVLHERDLLIVNKKWNGLNPIHADLLMDWFMREFRPALFRPEKAHGLNVSIAFQLKGKNMKGTMTIQNNKCGMENGGVSHPDLIIKAETEDLIAFSLARAAPFVGRISRILSLFVPPRKKEDFVAAVTGYTCVIHSLLTKKIIIMGDANVRKQMNKVFWHFWQRSIQNEKNIARYFTNL